MKQVRETKAGKSISAWVVVKNGKCIATVHAHYGNSGRVQVDVWHNCTMADGTFPELQQRSAGGYGYDKLTAALSGLSIDGNVLHDHATPGPAGALGVDEANGGASHYYRPGLELLTALGYTVIQAI